MNATAHSARCQAAVLVALAVSLTVGGTATALPYEPCYDEADRSSLPFVSDEGFRIACDTWLQGSNLERDAFLHRAIVLLERALEVWDVPKTRFRLARAHTNLDQPERALVHAWSAMKLGGVGLSFEEVQVIERIERYALDHGLVHLVLVVDDTSTIRLAGRVVFTGPGRWHGIVGPGAITLQHRRVGAKLWEATRSVNAGQRISLVWSPQGTNVPAEPTMDIGPRRHSEIADLMLSLVGFVVAYPGHEAHAKLLAPRNADPASRFAGQPTAGPDHEPGELPRELSVVCAPAKSKAARRVCDLYGADRRRFADRINAVLMARLELLSDLNKQTR